MEDEKIIGLFLSRSEQAITELDRKHGRLCRSISRNILHNEQDAEECVNDTYLGVWNSVPPQHPNPLLPFVCRIVRNISIARYHHSSAQKRGGSYTTALTEIEDMLPSRESAEARLDMRELTKLIAEFLDAQSTENRVIFLRRYWFCDSYEDIAGRVCLSVKTVSVRLVRMREKLKKHLESKGVNL